MSITRPAARYGIRVQGAVDAHWSDWFSGLALAEDCDAAGRPCSTLSGTVADQAALRGILNKLWDLNLTLVSVTRLEE